MDVSLGGKNRHLRADRQILDSSRIGLLDAGTDAQDQEAKPRELEEVETPGVRCIADRCSCNGGIGRGICWTDAVGLGGFDLLRRDGRARCAAWTLPRSGRRRPSVVIFSGSIDFTTQESDLIRNMVLVH